MRGLEHLTDPRVGVHCHRDFGEALLRIQHERLSESDAERRAVGRFEPHLGLPSVGPPGEREGRRDLRGRGRPENSKRIRVGRSDFPRSAQ